jgi:hypothetical protein
MIRINILALMKVTKKLKNKVLINKELVKKKVNFSNLD